MTTPEQLRRAHIDRRLAIAAERRDSEGNVDIRAFTKVARAERYDEADPAAAQDTLGQAQHAESTRGALAGAWHTDFPMSADYVAILDAAAAHASEAEHWVALAEEVFDGQIEHTPTLPPKCRSRVEDYLERALPLAFNEVDKRRVARGFQVFLAMPERAERIAPLARHPDDIAEFYYHNQPDWSADPAALLTLLRRRVTLPILEDIAQADYGFHWETYLVPLVACWETGRVPTPLWEGPHEVLSLSQWSELSSQSAVKIAFSSTLLLIDALGPDCPMGRESTLATGLEAAIALGREETEAYLSLVVTLVNATLHINSLHLFGLLAMLLAAARLNPRDTRLGPLADRLLTNEALHADNSYSIPEHGWLLGTTSFDQRHDLWRELAADILGVAVRVNPDHGILDTVRTRLLPQ